jgi:pantothenate synthetase
MDVEHMDVELHTVGDMDIQQLHVAQHMVLELGLRVSV